MSYIKKLTTQQKNVQKCEQAIHKSGVMREYYLQEKNIKPQLKVRGIKVKSQLVAI